MATIRLATREDIPRILELYEELTETKQIVSPESTRRVFEEIIAMPRHQLLVATEDGLVLGTVLLQIIPNLSHDCRPWAILENLVVDSRYRGRGIGRLLVEYTLARSREAGCYKVQLLSHKRRQAAHRFYRALGFEDSALGFRLYPQGSHS
ncbi:MAG: GNAT family N-acetyltransferase [Dehalococcoidales bacterium]|nr:GNAT family N-acetyltransferase [Dehalococcoidales bacterium]